ncbi:MAG TPA: glutamine amidotransferase [Actinomycetota bacterium]
MTDLVIAHLYPDLLRTYGDRGNVVTLRKRAEWRGFGAEVAEVHRDEPLPPAARVVLIGGGSDRIQEVLGDDMRRRAGELREAIERDAVVLGICGGYQLLGHSYTAADGSSIEGLGLLDVTTGAGPGRIIGRVRARGTLDGESFELFGFENHGGRTTLGPDATPLARVPHGQGNNGTDGGEGAVQGGIVGTYLHGPVLPVNPAFADRLLARALAPVTGGEPLAPLDDRLEDAARREAAGLKR